MKKKTPETIVKTEVKSWLNWNGWFTHHLMAGLGSYPGLSDIIAMKNGVVLFIEIKSKTGKQSENQTTRKPDCMTHFSLAFWLSGFPVARLPLNTTLNPEEL